MAPAMHFYGRETEKGPGRNGEAKDFFDRDAGGKRVDSVCANHVLDHYSETDQPGGRDDDPKRPGHTTPESVSGQRAREIKWNHNQTLPTGCARAGFALQPGPR